MNKFGICLVTLLSLALSPLTPVTAQVTGATIRGTVSNQLHEPVAGAKVVAVHVSTNQTRTTLTDEEGRYRLPVLSVGTYEITVEADKYEKTTQQVAIRVNEDTGVDVELPAAGASEHATVVATAAPLTETSSSVLGLIIENKQITELPLNGRNFLNLGTLVPTVNSTPSLRSAAEGGARNGPFAVSGQRDRSLTFLVDGVDNTNTLSDALSARPSIDSIQEFKMITSLGPAEYGYHAGGTINIVTKAGSNDTHFTLFEFFRNDVLNAANYFEKVAGRSASHFVDNQFGGTLGGRLVKDKVFYLGNIETNLLRAGTAQFSNVPTDAQRSGIFRNPATGQNVQLPVDPVSAEILRRFIPLSNVQTKYGNFFSTPNTTADNTFGMFRVDALLTGDDVLNVRYYIYHSDISYAINPEGVRFTAARPATIPGFALIEPTGTQNLAIGHTHNFSTQTVNDFRFGYNKYYLDQNPETQIRPADVGFTGTTPGVGSIIFNVTGMSTFGAIAYPIHSRFGNFHISDSLAFMKGSHALKFGGDIRFIRQSLQHFEPGHSTIVFNGSASRISPIADFVLGVPVVVNRISKSQGAPMRQQVGALFVQDDYQVTRNLVLNVGLRYEIATVLTSPTHALTNFSFSRGLFTPGVDTDTELYKGDHNNFAPRAGFAWSVTGDGRTVLRGGYGIFFDTIVHTNASQMNRQNSGPFSFISIAPRGPGKLGGMLDPSKLIPGPIPAVAYDENLRTPYAQHYNLTLQRELGHTMILSFGYVGSRGVKLTTTRDINQAIHIPGTDSNGKPLSTGDPLNIASRRPTQLFHLTPYVVNGMDELETGASSTYHALQASFNKRLSRGLSVLGTYTWSKSIDNSADPYGFTGDSGGPQNAYDYTTERAVSIFDSRHQLTVGYAYHLPFHGGKWVTGWQVNGISSYRSGQPFNAVLGFDSSFTGTTFLRPNHVPGAFTNKDGQLFLNRNIGPLDPATGLPAALIPKPGQFGTLGRNVFLGAAYTNFDMSLVKDTPIGEKLKVQVRLETFNLFNTANLALPERRLIDPLFGLSSRTQDIAGGLPGIGGGGPRALQVALKIVY